jgi:glycosyltransferase involved in cell wall biosynthesis
MMLYKTVTRLNPDYFDSTVIAMTKPGKVGEMLVKKGMPVLSLGMTRGRPDPAGMWKLYRLLKRLRPQILQTYMYHADLLGYLVGRWVGVPVIVWNIRCSNMDFSCYRRTTRWTSQLSARLSAGVDLILVNSWAGREVHVQLGYNAEKMVVVPNGVELDRFRPDRARYLQVRQELGLDSEARLVGLVARFDPMKDHKNFLQAAAKVLLRYPQTFFLLVGRGTDGDNPFLKKMVESSGIDTNHLFLLGERNDIPRINAALDVAVSSSAFGEGFSNAIGEAMACGVPCVVTDVGDSGRIVDDTGLVVPPRDPERLSRAILDLLELEPAAYLRRSKVAVARIKNHFAIDLITGKMEELYQKLAQQKLNGFGPPSV